MNAKMAAVQELLEFASSLEAEGSKAWKQKRSAPQPDNNKGPEDGNNSV